MIDSQPDTNTKFRKSSEKHILIASVLILAAIFCIFRSYPVFSITVDEPFHVAAGMEWLVKGEYTIEWIHPPLGRIFVALGPYIQGLPFLPNTDGFQSGVNILQSDGNYDHNVMLARLGTIPFFALACAVVFLWGYRWFSVQVGLGALGLFAMLPPILGHSSLATNDICACSTCGLCLYQFLRWLEIPNWRQCCLMGLSLGLAALGKFNSILFVCACLLVTLLYWVLLKNKETKFLKEFAGRRPQVLVSLSLATFIIWGGYRFSLAPLSELTPNNVPFLAIDQFFGSSPMLKHAAYQAISTPLPLQQLVGGLIQAANFNQSGHFTYLLGETSSTGWWYFFPIVLLVKTPIPFLLLALAGITHGLAQIQIAKWQRVLTALFPIAILAFCMTVRINLGVRHLLVLYIPLAVLAAHAMHKLMARYPGYIGRVAAVLLVSSTLGSTLLAQPDNLAYFNFLAGRNPEKILAESDLDWGQDLYRLRDRFKQLGSPEVAVAYFGSQPLASSGIENYTILSPTVPTAGYVAISLRFSVMEFREFGRYQWLQQYRPIERVGKSIDLYYINLAGPDLR